MLRNAAGAPWELVLGGVTYQQAADKLGYANRGTVHRVTLALRDRRVDTIDDLRALEVDRLDARE